MNDVLIALGGNLGNVPDTFERAVILLSGTLRDGRMSRLYRSVPVYDKPGAVMPETRAPDYINAVLRAQTDAEPHALLARLLEVERMLGRVRPAPECSPRTIDLDLLLYQDCIIRPQFRGDLEIPHPRMHQRAFVLVPACDVAPEWGHPVLKQNLRELADCVESRETVQPCGA